MRRISHAITRFLREDPAQDLVEYSLLIAFLAIAAVGVLIQVGAGSQGIWGTASTTLVTANGNPGVTATTAPGGGGQDHHGDGDDR